MFTVSLVVSLVVSLANRIYGVSFNANKKLMALVMSSTYNSGFRHYVDRGYIDEQQAY